MMDSLVVIHGNMKINDWFLFVFPWNKMTDSLFHEKITDSLVVIYNLMENLLSHWFCVISLNK